MEVNNMKTIIQNSILACLAFCMGTACTKESGMEETSHGKGYLEVFATIGKASTAPTRADGDTENKADAYGVPMDPLYSYLSTGDGGGFQNNGKCKIGIYSLNGTDGKNDEGRLVSTPLTYKGGSFVNEDIEISSMTNLGPTFAYYPYSEVNSNKSNINTNGTLKYELDIYKDDSNNPYTEGNNNTVIDLLTASNSGSLSGGKISYSFRHACSMLLIYRGEGFDQKSTGVTVKIKQGLKAYVYRGTSGNFSLTTNTDDTTPTEFKTNYCSSYQMEGSEEAKPVYSVILPPGATVEYIKLEDNFGTMQYVYPEEEMKLNSGTRYPVTVKLDGLYPTIYPHDIVAWNDEPITIDPTEKTPGIYSLENFQAWITAYTANPQNETDLEKYGEKENEQSPWTFHLYADIDCSTITNQQFLIPTFTDCLEGHGHTLKNVTLTKAEDETDANIGVIGELKEGGSINNLKIDSITVSGETIENDYIGTLVGTITDGSITKCKITGINIDCENGKVGALAGKIETGTIETCLLEGNLQLGKEAITAENSKKLFGEMGTNFNFSTDATDINTSGVYVFKANTDPVSGGNGDGTDIGSGDGTDIGNGDGTNTGSSDGTDTGNNTGNEGNTDGGGN